MLGIDEACDKVKMWRGYNCETGEAIYEYSKSAVWARILISIQFKTISRTENYSQMGNCLAQWDVKSV